MTTRSTAKKVLQSFHARTTLWAIFETRAREMECTIDYLINESMRFYATTNGFLGDDDPPQRDTMALDRARTAPSHDAPTLPPAQMASNSGLPRPSAPAQRSSGVRPLPRPSGTGSSAAPPPIPPRPPVPTSSSVASHLPRLTLIYQGSKIPIAQEQFIIGRGSKSSDLAIKDSNVSRKHAAILYHNSTFYLKDLGSTNGIEFGGKQVDSKRIDEGDVFFICGHEFHFTYQV